MGSPATSRQHVHTSLSYGICCIVTVAQVSLEREGLIAWVSPDPATTMRQDYKFDPDYGGHQRQQLGLHMRIVLRRHNRCVLHCRLLIRIRVSQATRNCQRHVWWMPFGPWGSKFLTSEADAFGQYELFPLIVSQMISRYLNFRYTIVRDTEPDLTTPGRYILGNKGHFQGLVVHSDGTVILTTNHRTADNIITTPQRLLDM